MRLYLIKLCNANRPAPLYDSNSDLCRFVEAIDLDEDSECGAFVAHIELQ